VVGVLVGNRVQLAIGLLTLEQQVRQARIRKVRLTLDPVSKAEIADRKAKIIHVGIQAFEHLDALLEVFGGEATCRGPSCLRGEFLETGCRKDTTTSLKRGS
jgi:hypothetical protein